ncbi:LysM domain-containing protein [Bowdeniella nasicola]|uniref:LysM domain-containing protein n=1 Tax=Bowdeniella nasicola TaxID=208480 RepID=A0A1H4BBF9_9ACTO|nr:LysM peptidoglycan-binding domain-containing protein [Bowdeniella nasicola]SEA45483.1 LysM domain-containing protein [Bowdeniella nasicola]
MTALPLAALPELAPTRGLRLVGGKDVEAARPATLPFRPLPAAAPARPLPLTVPQAAPADAPTAPAAAPASAAAATSAAARAATSARTTGLSAKLLKAALGWTLAAALTIGVAGGIASALNPPVTSSGVTVTVTAGQSLWSIAAAHTENAAATRDYVAAIIALNGLDSATIEAGQALTLPKLP